LTDEDEDSDDGDVGGTGGYMGKTHPPDLADLPTGAETSDRRHEELDREQEQNKTMKAGKQAQRSQIAMDGATRVTTSSVVVPN